MNLKKKHKHYIFFSEQNVWNVWKPTHNKKICAHKTNISKTDKSKLTKIDKLHI